MQIEKIFNDFYNRQINFYKNDRKICIFELFDTLKSFFFFAGFLWIKFFFSTPKCNFESIHEKNFFSAN